MPALDELPERVNHDGCHQGTILCKYGQRYDSTCATIEVENGDKYTVQIHAGQELPDWAKNKVRTGTAKDAYAGGIMRRCVESAIREACKSAGNTVYKVDYDRASIHFRIRTESYSLQITPSPVY